MSIGYASLALGVPGARLRSITSARATPERLEALIEGNLVALDALLDYNHANGIRLFRVSSDIIPFGSSPVNTLDWQTRFADQLAALGAKARRFGIRLSMHPGQYTVLNSPDAGVVERAVADLSYHAAFLDALGMDSTAKVILHVGGIYGDKPAALRRFARAYAQLPQAIVRRLVVENDDRLYTAQDVLALSRKTGAPMVFDILHHQLNQEQDSPDAFALIDAAAETWGNADGAQKIHFPQQAAGRRPGSHSDTIAVEPFLTFYRHLETRRGAKNLPDIMLEVKDKNLSAIKCLACTDTSGRISVLEREWARYKYRVLEHDQAIYQRIRKLLNNKDAYPAVPFYQLVEQAEDTPPSAGSFRNAAQHVWGYMANEATQRERATFATLMERFSRGETTGAAVKKRLYALAEKYEQPYLLQSYYFVPDRPGAADPTV